MVSPEQYEEICGRLIDYDIPSSEECMSILTRKLTVTDGVLAHSNRVAQVALHLTRALNTAGCGLNEKLVLAASLLHDLAKGRPNHAAVGAQMVAKMGYPTVAHIVAAHMKIEFSEERPIRERDIVSLADKLVEGDQLVGLEERHQKKLDECSDDERVCNAIADRLANSLKLKRKIEACLGSSLEFVLTKLPGENYAQQAVDLPAEAR